MDQHPPLSRGGSGSWHRDLLREVVSHGQDIRPHVEYQERPLDWVVEKLEVGRETLVWSANEGYEDHQWDGAEDPFVHALEALADWKNVGIESGVGTGKTFWLACIIMWFLACWEDSIVVTAAPKEDQLLDKVWKEIGRLWPRFQRHFPQARLMDSGEIRMRGDGASRTWKAKAEVTGVRAGETSATKAQGEHAEHMLIVTEETPGMHPAVLVAYENTRTAPHNLQVSVGNPDYQEDPLHEFCEQPDVEHIRISALDHPNVVTGDASLIPGACSRASVERLKAKYEHTPALYQSRVRGMSPEQAHGVALHCFSRSEQLRELRTTRIRAAIQEHRWPVYIGIDPGDLRWAAVVGIVDPKAQMHSVRELFSQQEVLGKRMNSLLSTLDQIGVTEGTTVRAWYDSAAAAQGREMNRLLAERGARWRIRKSEKRVIKRAEGVVQAYRRGSVTRINELLHAGDLLFAKDLGRGMEWRKGQDSSSEGKPMRGSRLLWEIRNWRYPERREGQAQREDPDDGSADGADAIAALRYLIMGWWKQRAPTEEERKERKRRAKLRRQGRPHWLPEDEFDERGNRVRDRGLERLAVIEDRKRRARRGYYGWTFWKP